MITKRDFFCAAVIFVRSIVRLPFASDTSMKQSTLKIHFDTIFMRTMTKINDSLNVDHLAWICTDYNTNHSVIHTIKAEMRELEIDTGRGRESKGETKLEERNKKILI